VSNFVVGKMKKLYLVLALFLTSLFGGAQNPLAGSGYTYESGNNSYITIPAGIDSLSFPITIASWVKPSGFGQRPLFCSQVNPTAYSGFSIMATATNVQVIFGDGTGFSFFDTKTFSVNTGIFGFNADWYHLAVVINSESSVNIYINGVLKTGNSFGFGGAMESSPTRSSAIGYRDASFFDQYFDGEIDEFAIWDRALLQGQIRRVMTTGINKYQIDQVLRYNMNSVVGTSVPDGTSNAWNGTITGTGVSFPFSGAAVGDTSIWGFAATYPFTLSWPNGNGPSVTTNNSNITGFYIYRVSGQPNTLSGLSPCPEDPYWGVYTVREGFSFTPPTYTTTYAGKTTISRREDNSESPWYTGNFSTGAVVDSGRGEFVYDYTIDTTGFIVSEDTSVCGQSFTIEGPLNAAGLDLLWSTGDTTSNITVSTSGTYILQIDEPCYNGWDTVIVNINPLDSFDVADTASCDASPIQIDLPDISPGIYTWSNGNVGNSQTFASAGTYYVTATNGPCTFSDTFSVYHMQPVDVPDYSICDGVAPTIFLPDISPGVYQWSDGSTGNNFTPSSSGTYWVRAVLFQCTEVDTFVVDLVSSDVDVLPEYEEHCLGSIVSYTVPEMGYEIEWSNGIFGTTGYPTASGWLTVTYRTYCGDFSDSVFVDFVPCRDAAFFEPSGFTPNGDGVNDIYLIKGFLGSSFEMRIYDRWGREVFMTRDPNQGWDGADEEPGVFMVRFLYRDQNDKEKEKITHITLYR